MRRAVEGGERRLVGVGMKRGTWEEVKMRKDLG